MNGQMTDFRGMSLEALQDYYFKELEALEDYDSALSGCENIRLKSQKILESLDYINVQTEHSILLVTALCNVSFKKTILLEG